MKIRVKISIFVSPLIAVTIASAQRGQVATPTHYLDLTWKHVATRMPDTWYGSGEAKQVAENVLLFQKEIGGWAKNKPYHHPLTEAAKVQVLRDKSGIGATFDNGATVNEMKFLARVHAKIKDERYRKAFEKGMNFIFDAQYDNGGWPQFFPFRKEKSVAYASHITYNDDAMVNVMMLLRDIVKDKALYASLQISKEMRNRAKESFDKGVECILKTQIIVDGHPTVWCAQHDEFALAPAKARSYELPSFSGQESAGVTLLLMDIESPSKGIIDAIRGAVKWFESNKIEGIQLKREVGKSGRKDVVVVEDKNAPPLWARFYDLETGKPYFSDRDGVKKNTLAEIGYNRRNGYSWYSNRPAKVLKRYPEWTDRWGIK